MAELTAAVKAGATDAKVKWTEPAADEFAAHGELPEFRFTAYIPGGNNYSSKLLKVGAVTRVDWVAPSFRQIRCARR